MSNATVWGMNELTVLGFIARTPARATRYAIAQELAIPVPSVYRIVNGFEAAGLVVREIERVNPMISTREPRVLFRATTMAADALNASRSAVAEKQPA